MEVKKILVVDDSELHRESAEKFLGKEYDVTIVSNPDEAVAKLRVQYDDVKEAELLEAAGFPKGFKPWDESVTDEQRKLYWIEQDNAHEASRLPFAYDAVLLDLLMPATETAMGREGRRLVGKLMPYGYSLALLAIQNGAKLVGILTDANHHDHPMSAALDPLSLGKVLMVGESRFVIAREYFTKLVHPDKDCPECGGTGDIGSFRGEKSSQCYYCKGSGQEHSTVKDWGKLLEVLMA